MIIHDLGIILVCAVAVTILFHRLKLPVIFGYLLSGVLVGPHLFDVSPISQTGSVQELSELGVVFLMFYIGLEFDLQKLQRLLGPSLVAVCLQTVVLVFLGMQVAPLLGMHTLDGVFLGALLAISSSMVVFSVLKEKGELGEPYAQMAIGVLILEDILAIIMLVLLTGVSVTGHWKWASVWQTTFLVGVFVVMVYVVGKLVAPTLLRLLHRIGSMELINLFSVAVVLGVSVLAENFHFTPALGAFLAGSILAQSSMVHEIEKAIEPLKNTFNAVFFVSIGMLVKPALLWEQWPTILLVSGVKVFGTLGACFLGLFLSGQKARTSFRAAAIKCQIGEFSFIIAGLGERFGVTDARLMTVAVGVTLLTILVTPPLTNRSGTFFDFLRQRVPQNLILLARFYHNVMAQVREQLSRSAFLRLVQRPLLQILLYFFILTGILIMAYLSADFGLRNAFLRDYLTVFHALVWMLAAFLCVPFLVALIRNVNATLMLLTESVLSTASTRQFMQGRMRNIFNTLILWGVLFVVGLVYLSFAAPYFPSGLPLLASFVLIMACLLFFWRHMVKLNSQIEYHFMESFNQRTESLRQQRTQQVFSQILKKYPWPVQLHEVEILPGTVVGGQRIAQLHLREKFGVSVIAISREDYLAHDPGPETTLFPGDVLIVFGSQAQVQQAREALAKPVDPAQAALSDQELQVEKFFLSQGTSFLGETLAKAALRKRYGVNVIGIQRQEERLTSPGAHEVLQPEDIIFVAGTSSAIAHFREHLQAEQSPT